MIWQLITWKKEGLNGYLYDFSVDYIDTNKVINIHKYLMKILDIK